jgi:hypothetical protein
VENAVVASAIWHVAPVGDDMHSAFTIPEVLHLVGPDDSVYLRATQRFRYGPHPRYPGERKVVTAEYAAEVLRETLRLFKTFQS